MKVCDCGADADGIDHEPFCAVPAPTAPIDATAVARAIVTAGPLEAVQTIGGPALMALAEHVLNGAA